MFKMSFLPRDDPGKKAAKIICHGHLSVNPLPSYLSNDIFKSDKLIEPTTPTLLHEIMSKGLINCVLIRYIYWNIILGILEQNT